LDLRLLWASFLVLFLSAVAFAGGAFTIRDAINESVATNPAVGEATANRRATETELRAQQSTLLPQVRLEARYGLERWNLPPGAPPPSTPSIGNNQTQTASNASITMRQLVFDGLTSLNEIWRQAARVDSAAARVHERTELIALDAADAYIEVVRYTHLVSIAQENVAAHQKILSNVQARFQGGRAGEGDLQQVHERVEAAQASLADFRERLDEARGTYRKVVGTEPFNLRVPGRLPGLPHSRDEALAVTLTHNPTIQAAQADKEVAKYAFHATAGSFLPTVSLEGRAQKGRNYSEIFGDNTDVGGFVVASWDIFRGGQDAWHRADLAERYTQQTMQHAKLQRDAYESIDKAWSARTVTAERIAALERQIVSEHKVIAAYQKEYELGQRSLIDLLNAQNGLFNGLVSLESARSVAVFADYQLLAAMGELLEYLKTAMPVDAEPLIDKPWGLIPYKLPAVLWKLPEPGSEPINVTYGSGTTAVKAAAVRAVGFADRWATTSGVSSADLPSWIKNPTGAKLAQGAVPTGSGSRQKRLLPEWLQSSAGNVASIVDQPKSAPAPANGAAAAN
jgi:outer membrane protein, adhesin transport system